MDKLVLFYRAEAVASAFMRFKGPGVGYSEYSLLNNSKPITFKSVTFYVGSVPIVITPEVDLLVRVAVTEVRTLLHVARTLQCIGVALLQRIL